MFARLVAPFAEGDAPLAVVFFYINIFPLRNDSTYFTRLNKYRGRRDSIDAFPLVRENSTSKEKEPMYVAFAFRAFALSLSLFACLRAFFIHSKFCIDRCREFFPRTSPRGCRAYFFRTRQTPLRNTRARVPKKKPSKEKRARAFCLSFFLSSSLSRAKAREKSARAAPKQRDFFVFAFSTINTLRVLHSLTYSNRQTDIFERKDLQKKKKKKKRKKNTRDFYFLDDGFDDDDDVVVVVPGDFDARKENTPSCAHGLAHRDSGVFFHDRTRAR